MNASIDTKQKLMQVATDLIWESNYDKVGIAEICKQAGVTKGAFYHHFKSKADLFSSACDNEWERMRRRMDEIFSPSKNALEQLEGLIDLTLEKQIRRLNGENRICGCPFFTAGAQAGCGDDEIRQVAQGMSDNGLRYYKALVRTLASEGYLNQCVDEEQAARLVQEFVQGLIMVGRIHQDFDKLRRDLREGIYRLLDLRQECRACPKEAERTRQQAQGA